VSLTKASKASESLTSVAVYARLSAWPDGGIGGRSGHLLKVPWVFRQSTRCSGVLSCRHEQVRFVSWGGGSSGWIPVASKAPDINFSVKVLTQADQNRLMKSAFFTGILPLVV
jgi:hypothetical protein